MAVRQKEATVWVEGLDRIHKLRGINFCVDLSATPYWLNRIGQEANRPFPWVVSDFSLMDSIESGLVKIPQLAIRDTTGAEIPGYFNIWRWILQPGRLTPAERGGKHSPVKPEAVLKWAHTPIAMLAGLWEAEFKAWRENGEPRPPVFIIVCKNTALANVIFDWLAKGKSPSGIPSAKLAEFRNGATETNTIVVHSKVVQETDTGTRPNPTSRAGCGSRRIQWEKLRGRPIRWAGSFIQTALRNWRKTGSSVPSTRTRRALHRQRRNADRRMGLQHRHARDRVASVHVAVAVRTGRRAAACAARVTRSARTD